MNTMHTFMTLTPKGAVSGDLKIWVDGPCDHMIMCKMARNHVYADDVVLATVNARALVVQSPRAAKMHYTA